MEPKNEAELIQAVGAWATRNFKDTRAPALGVAEEIGEAIHCVLKRKQGIRGFENEDFFIEQFTDALADCTIYLCDWCSIRDAFFCFGRNMQESNTLEIEHQEKLIANLLQGAAALISYDIYNDHSSNTSIANTIAQRVASGLEMWAGIYKINMRLAVSTTWANVSKRDWIANPKTAGNVKE